MRFLPLSFVSLFLAWELTGEEMLEGFVGFPVFVIDTSVGRRGFCCDWAPGVVQTVQIAHGPKNKCCRGMSGSTDEAQEHVFFSLLRLSPYLAAWIAEGASGYPFKAFQP